MPAISIFFWGTLDLSNICYNRLKRFVKSLEDLFEAWTICKWLRRRDQDISYFFGVCWKTSSGESSKQFCLKEGMKIYLNEWRSKLRYDSKELVKSSKDLFETWQNLKGIKDVVKTLPMCRLENHDIDDMFKA